MASSVEISVLGWFAHASVMQALFRTMMRSQRKGSRSGEQFFSASHFVHVRPMFEVAWIPFLAGISGPLQETDDLEVVELCLDGFRNAIRIVCFFDLELERNALAKAQKTNLEKRQDDLSEARKHKESLEEELEVQKEAKRIAEEKLILLDSRSGSAGRMPEAKAASGRLDEAGMSSF